MARNCITKTCSCPGYPHAQSLRIQCSRLGTDAAALPKQYFCLLGLRVILFVNYIRGTWSSLVKFTKFNIEYLYCLLLHSIDKCKKNYIFKLDLQQ